MTDLMFNCLAIAVIIIILILVGVILYKKGFEDGSNIVRENVALLDVASMHPHPDIEECLSQRIINSDGNAFISTAYNVSYSDFYDFASSSKEEVDDNGN